MQRVKRLCPHTPLSEELETAGFVNLKRELCSVYPSLFNFHSFHWDVVGVDAAPVFVWVHLGWLVELNGPDCDWILHGGIKSNYTCGACGRSAGLWFCERLINTASSLTETNTHCFWNTQYTYSWWKGLKWWQSHLLIYLKHTHTEGLGAYEVRIAVSLFQHKRWL